MASNAADIAANARPDLLGLSGLDLTRYIRICQRGSAKHKSICFALFEGVGTEVYIVHLRAGNYRNADVLFYLFIQIYAVSLIHVARRACIIERIIGAGVSHNRRVSIFFEHLGDLNSLLKSTAGFFIAMQRGFIQSLDIALDAKTHGHGIIAAADLVDTVHDFLHEPHLVLKRPAVFVFTFVRNGHNELIKQIAPMEGMYIDAGEARLLRERRSFDDAVALFVDLIDGERFRSHLRISKHFCGRRRFERRIVASDAKTDLAEKLCSVRAEPLVEPCGGRIEYLRMV